tara:strand:+ start:230 stop:655 length:426 start_codon:yes stop_codon:yes gene_type:complete
MNVQEMSIIDEQVLIVPGTLPQLNDVIRRSKGHWSSYHKDKKETENKIKVCILSQKMKKIEGPVFLHFSWTSKNARVDPDNIAFAKKFLLDALVTEQILPGDGRGVVKGWIDEFPDPDPDNPRVEVVLYTIGDTDGDADSG